VVAAVAADMQLLVTMDWLVRVVLVEQVELRLMAVLMQVAVAEVVILVGLLQVVLVELVVVVLVLILEMVEMERQTLAAAVVVGQAVAQRVEEAEVLG
tara:strand:+ start:159 stop:452 length:294 start_codon:yes stop_codon:yes gene_type:complete